MMLTDKIAVIYGAEARSAARSPGLSRPRGPALPHRPPLRGRHRRQEIASAGGTAEAAEVDALDEQASTSISSP